LNSPERGVVAMVCMFDLGGSAVRWLGEYNAEQ
jgi:hypothetical protein